MVSQRPWYSRAWASAVTTVSPRRGAFVDHFARMHYERDYRDGVLLAMRSNYGYKHAEQGDGKTPFRSGRGIFSRSADAQILTGLHHRRLREFARELVRDDAVACGLAASWVRNVVGTGITDRSATGDDATDDAIDAEWGALKDDLFPAERITWAEAQRILVRRLFVDGDVFVIRSMRPDGRIGFELVEGDRVRTPLDAGQVIAPDGYVREGVERDKAGRILAYWVARQHPGDQVVTGSVGKIPVPPLSAVDFVRVPADDCYHLKGPGRPGESRTPSALHAVIQDLRDLDLLVVAVLKRIQMAACFAMFIETSNAIPDLVAATARKYHYQISQDLVPGMIYILRPGERAVFSNPNFPLPDVDKFVQALARRIGAALGISWQIVLADFSQANFASQRADKLEAEATFAIPQQRVIDCIAWIRRVALEDATLRPGGLMVDAADLAQVAWIPPRKKWVDPEKQAKADKLDVEAGFACKRDKVAERGGDWQEVTRQCLREERFELDERSALGLSTPGEDLERALDTYGKAVRAGAITPVAEDEEHFRQLLGLPELPAGAREAWADEPTRRPITLTPPEQEPAPTDEPGSSEDADGELELVGAAAGDRGFHEPINGGGR